MFKDLTKVVPPIMNVLKIHKNLFEALLETANYVDILAILNTHTWF